MFNNLINLIKHALIYGGANFLQKGIGFIMIPVYTYYLTPADYGILELLDLSIMIITMITGMRLGSSIIRYYHHYEEKNDRDEIISTAFFAILTISILTVAALELCSESISFLILGDKKYSHYFQIVLIAMGFQTISTIPESLLLAEKRSIVYSAISICTLMSYLTFNILFIVRMEMGVMGMLLSMIITKSLNMTALIIIYVKRIKFLFSWNKFREMARFCIPLIPASFFMFSMHYSDRFFIQKYVNLNDVGIYSLGYKFGMIISILISQPFFRIWNTKRFEIEKENNAPYTFGKFFTYYLLIMLFAGLGISLFSKEVILLMAPPNYSNASKIISLIAISYIAYGVANFFTLGTMITFQTKMIAYSHFSAAIFNIFSNMLFIKYFGIEGAALSTILSFMFLAIVSIVISQSLYRISIEYFRIMILLGVTFSIYFISLAISFSLWPSLLLKVSIIIIYPLMLYLLKFFDEDEIIAFEKLKEILLKKAFGINYKQLASR
jgi:O-antigen/teichoic acid export membrane protein